MDLLKGLPPVERPRFDKSADRLYCPPHGRATIDAGTSIWNYRIMQIRFATPDDVPAITSIYGYHVLHGTGTFEEEPPPVDEMHDRLAKVRGRGWPWLVAERDSQVIGYAYTAQFRDRAAYRFAGEDSIYIHPNYMGAGVGRALLDELLPASAAAGFQRIFAVIGDSDNVGSIRLHERGGFEHCGKLDKAGFKFNRYLDVVFMQREI